MALLTSAAHFAQTMSKLENHVIALRQDERVGEPMSVCFCVYSLCLSFFKANAPEARKKKGALNSQLTSVIL